MAQVINMPRLSDTMEEGKIEVWHKKTGDKISYGEILAEIETDKAVQEFEADFDGTILWAVEAGKSIPVETPMIIIGEEGEDISDLIDGKSGSEKSSVKTSENADVEEGAQKNADEPAEIEEHKDDMDEVEESADSDNTKEDRSESFGESSDTEDSASAEIPEGVQVITMPRLSDTMEEGKVEVWHKNVGDKVAYGAILAEIETDKAVQEFEADFEGTLLYRIEEGQPVPVENLMAVVGPEGTDVSGIVSSGGKKKAKAKKSTEEKPVKEVKDSDGSDKKEKSESKEIETIQKDESKSDEKTIKSGRVFISPLAQKLAEEKGFDIHEIKGSGDNGRIIKRDVEQHQPAAKSVGKAAPVTVAAIPAGEDQKVENSKMRQTIAKRLSQSKFTAPHYYLNIEVDMDNVMAARKQINEIAESKISFNDIIVKAVAMALRKHPQVNSTWTDKEMILHGDINIGVAVAVPDGLVVPVVKNTDHKSLSQIAEEIKDLATRSRDRKIKADELDGSTFTVSNLGAYGIESFTSIINQPNSCILSVGAIVEKPVVKNGQIVVGNRMKLSMACDHRTVDGATGSLYLQTLKQYLETPMAMFL